MKRGSSKLMERLEQAIAEQETALEESHAATAGQSDGDLQQQMPPELTKARKLSQQVKEAMAKVTSGESRHVHPLDQEARRMGEGGRNRFCYNAQAVVDHQEQIIVAAEVVNEANDARQLAPMARAAQQNTGATQCTTLADGGYSAGAQLQEMEQEAREALAPLPGPAKKAETEPYHSAHFQHDPINDEVICPQGNRLPFRRERQRSGGVVVREYRCAQVCKGCPVREQCTQDRHGRSIEVAPWDGTLREHRKKMETPLNAALLKMRAGIVEPVFSWIKQQGGFRRWTVRGLENVRTQWALVCSGINLGIIYRSWRKMVREQPGKVNGGGLGAAGALEAGVILI